MVSEKSPYFTKRFELNAYHVRHFKLNRSQKSTINFRFTASCQKSSTNPRQLQTFIWQNTEPKRGQFRVPIHRQSPFLPKILDLPGRVRADTLSLARALGNLFLITVQLLLHLVDAASIRKSRTERLTGTEKSDRCYPGLMLAVGITRAISSHYRFSSHSTNCSAVIGWAVK